MPRLILAKVLKEKGISKRRFAQLLGISYHNVFRLFHADSDPRFSTLVKWSRVLRCKVCDLIRD
jgi:DNA-binding Xre family transcriptional regulator